MKTNQEKDWITIKKLEKVLKYAALAPGNQERFLAAGLISSQSNTKKPQLVKDWQTAFCQLSALPKKTVRDHPGSFLSAADDIVYRGVTSGSRGQHFIYFAGENWNEARIRSRYHSLDWWGIDDTVQIINVASQLFPLGSEDATIVGVVNSGLIQPLLEQIAFKRSALRGYPSRLCEVATLLNGKVIPPVVAIICTGEYLFDFQKSFLEKIFSAPIINEYGCQEAGISALTCPEVGKLHLDTNRCLFEFVDDQLVTTDLFNCVIPLVRYQCGDLLRLHPNQCSCGRPEPTADLLGRNEDWIRTASGLQRTGQILMPPFNGILHYQVIRETRHQIALHIHTGQNNSSSSFSEIRNWVKSTFGNISIQTYINDTPNNFPPEQNLEVSNKIWIHGITQEPWEKWLNASILPEGELKHAAQILKDLTMPKVITYGRLTSKVNYLIQNLLDQDATQISAVEFMKNRVLLFACSSLAGDPRMERIYLQVIERLNQLINIAPEFKHEIALDILISTLTCKVNLGVSIWKSFLDNALLKQSIQPDVFNIQHLLYAFESAVSMTKKNRYKVFNLSQLTPMLSVLIGDLEWLSRDIEVSCLAHWFELIHGINPNIMPAQPSKNIYLQTWLIWREKMIYRSSERTVILKKLGEIASTDQEKARTFLEEGYEILMKSHPINPDRWLPILQHSLNSKTITHIAWVPILRGLAKSLLERKEHQLAYEYLQLTNIPFSKTTVFERLVQPCNKKQSVLLDFNI